MPLTDSLISYWKLDEASGNALDAHGSNNLTDNNTVGSATGKISNGRDFERDNSEDFSIADNASLSTGDIDFTFTAWVNLESKPAASMIIISKEMVDGTEGEYFLYYNNTADRFKFHVFGAALWNSEGTVLANNLGSPSTGTWYFVVAWHDSVANTINIQVNNGAVNSQAHSAGVYDGAAPFYIGGTLPITTQEFDGIIDEVGFWKRVLTSGERTQLYNWGNGLAYPFRPRHGFLRGRRS